MMGSQEKEQKMTRGIVHHLGREEEEEEYWQEKVAELQAEVEALNKEVECLREG